MIDRLQLREAALRRAIAYHVIDSYTLQTYSEEPEPQPVSAGAACSELAANAII